jgi:GT2 family glycosyltransferase/MoaA/NifB/PqqE/SkfB family radical SAM enzyme/glycosyltransferase involved in cell wall biosynthesis
LGLSGLIREKQEAIDSFEAFFRGEGFPQWPLEVFLEVSNICNLKCAMCAPFSALNPNRMLALAEQPRGVLDFAGVQHALEPVLRHALYIHAFGYGEPTVHPEFLELLRTLSQYGSMIDFITNGMRLTSELCEAVVDGRVAQVVVSVSGSTKADYEGVYLGGAFDVVLAGLKRLSEARLRAGSPYPRVTVNSIAFRHHIESLPAFVDLMAEHGVDVVEVKKLMDDVDAMAGHAAPYRLEIEGALVAEARARAYRHGMQFSAEQYERETPPGSGDARLIPIGQLRTRARQTVQTPATGRDQQPESRELAHGEPIEDLLGIAPLDREHFGTDEQFYCLEPFKTMYIRRGGLVKPCCFAPDGAAPLGDVRREMSNAIWNGGGFTTVRRSIVNARYPKPACESCIRRGSGPKGNVIRERIRAYVEWFHRCVGRELSASSLADVAMPVVVSALKHRESITLAPPPMRVGNGLDIDAIRVVREAIEGNSFLKDEREPSAARATDVVVPIYNAPVELARCLTSVARETHSPFRLVLVNDGSTDPAVSALLAGLAGSAPRVVIVERSDNRGFVRSVNDAIALSSSNDLVLLNSDTVVTANWLAKLVAVARSRPAVATVTPLTNNGTLCSVPIPFEDNTLPSGYDIESFAALIEATSLRIFPEAPTGVGFCMLMTRRAIDAVGTFDAETFGRGYGEENDFCQRAARAGWVNLIADDTFVYHKGRASFGAAGDELRARNLRLLAARHPGYSSEVERFCRDHPLKPFHALLKGTLTESLRGMEVIDLRVLHILHNGGGTERHVRDLASLSDPRVLSCVLRSDGLCLTLDRYHAGRCVDTMRFPLMAPIGVAGPLFDDGYKKIMSTICWALDVDLIHVHHLMHNTLDIADVSAERNIPYVVTLHDYYAICPSYTLLDDDGNPCADCRRGATGRAATACMQRFGKPESYLGDHQRHMHEFLNRASRLVVPSDAAKRVIGERFPDLAQRIGVIEHGQSGVSGPEVVTRSGPDVVARSPVDGPRKGLNVAFIGSLDLHKGLRVFRDVLRANRLGEITFHLYGTSPDFELASEPGVVRKLDGSRFVYHGPYDSREITGTLVADGIDVGLQPAIWPETFSYTLSEFTAAGVPAIVGDLGAQAERARRFGLGWIVPDIRDPKAILNVLEYLVEHPEAAGRMSASMNHAGALRPIDMMWSDYLETYRALTRDGSTPPVNAPLPDKSYVTHLARKLAVNATALVERQGLDSRAEAELLWFRERMRSPRHRLADAAANAIQKIPIVWPAIAAVTDLVLRLQNRRPKG